MIASGEIQAEKEAAAAIKEEAAAGRTGKQARRIKRPSGRGSLNAEKNRKARGGPSVFRKKSLNPRGLKSTMKEDRTAANQSGQALGMSHES